MKYIEMNYLTYRGDYRGATEVAEANPLGRLGKTSVSASAINPFGFRGTSATSPSGFPPTAQSRRAMFWSFAARLLRPPDISVHRKLTATSCAARKAKEILDKMITLTTEVPPPDSSEDPEAADRQQPQQAPFERPAPRVPSRLAGCEPRAPAGVQAPLAI